MMFNNLKTWLQLKTDRRGVTMLEYAIMGSIIAGALVVAVPLLTHAVATSFNQVSGDVAAGATSGATNGTPNGG
jgi:Flp pilus assembly pilin Flp